MYISLITGIYSIYLVISASFMRYILNFIKSRTDSFFLSVCISVIFVILCVGLVVFMIIKKKFVNLVALVVLFIAVILYTLSFKIVEERIHILQFGLLGFLTSYDNCKEKNSYFYPLIWAFIMASIDELFQFYLPNRVGDGRDIFFGVVGGIFGIILHFVIFKVNYKKGEFKQ